MVLMRLGYVARNGGEELLSWMLREGPKDYTINKAARTSVNNRVVYDAYGKRVSIIPGGEKYEEALKLDELASVDTSVSIETQLDQSILFRPITGAMRFVNELAGWGDMAVTMKALKRSVKAEGAKWQFLEPDQMVGIFSRERTQLLKEIDSRPMSAMGRQMLVWGHATSNRYARFVQGFAQKAGIPTRRELATKYLTKVDPDHELRLMLATAVLSQPTMLDQQMKSIIGGYDTYANFDKSGLTDLLRSNRAVGSTVDQLLKLPMDYASIYLCVIKILRA